MLVQSQVPMSEVTPMQRIILLALKHHNAPMSSAEIAAATKLKEETAKRYALMLRKHGIVASFRKDGVTLYLPMQNAEV